MYVRFLELELVHIHPPCVHYIMSSRLTRLCGCYCWGALGGVGGPGEVLEEMEGKDKTRQGKAGGGNYEINHELFYSRDGLVCDVITMSMSYACMSIYKCWHASSSPRVRKVAQVLTQTNPTRLRWFFLPKELLLSNHRRVYLHPEPPGVVCIL